MICPGWCRGTLKWQGNMGGSRQRRYVLALSRYCHIPYVMLSVQFIGVYLFHLLLFRLLLVSSTPFSSTPLSSTPAIICQYSYVSHCQTLSYDPCFLWSLFEQDRKIWTTPNSLEIILSTGGLDTSVVLQFEQVRKTQTQIRPLPSVFFLPFSSCLAPYFSLFLLQQAGECWLPYETVLSWIAQPFQKMFKCMGLSCQGLNSAVPRLKVVICAWTIKQVDIPLTEAKIAINPLKIIHKGIISLAIRLPNLPRPFLCT